MCTPGPIRSASAVRVASVLPGRGAAGGAGPPLPPERGFLNLSGRDLEIFAPRGARVTQQPVLPRALRLPVQLQGVWAPGCAGFGMLALGCWFSGSSSFLARRRFSTCQALTYPNPGSSTRGGTGKLGWFCSHPAQGVWGIRFLGPDLVMHLSMPAPSVCPSPAGVI